MTLLEQTLINTQYTHTHTQTHYIAYILSWSTTCCCCCCCCCCYCCLFACFRFPTLLQVNSSRPPIQTCQKVRVCAQICTPVVTVGLCVDVCGYVLMRRYIQLTKSKHLCNPDGE